MDFILMSIWFKGTAGRICYVFTIGKQDFGSPRLWITEKKENGIIGWQIGSKKDLFKH